jgi:two-component system sensor histidine kinase TctE
VKIFQREQRSLFGEILDWMLTPLLLLWPVSLALTWLVAQGLANKPFDRALEYNAHALAQLVTVQHSKVQFNLPQPASEILRADDSDIVYYQVTGPGRKFLSGERDLPLPDDDDHTAPGEVRLRDAELRGVEIRVAYIWVRLALPDAPLALVQVAETREKRSVLATEIIKGVMLPQFVILPLAVLLVWLALARGIQPLNQLEQRIRERSPDDLSPLDDRTVPLEVAPLVSSVNDLLTRLGDSLATQKRFLADAAHQLKTPLAGLRMQADLAQREGTSTEELKRSLQQIGRSSIRATHTVNQLLALARAEGSGVGIARVPCDLAKLTIEVVRDSVPARSTSRSTWATTAPSRAPPVCGWTATPPCSRSWCATWWTTPSTTPPRPPTSPAWSPPACWPTPLAMCCCCRWKTLAPACPRPSASWFFSLFTGRWAARPTARAWVCPS